MQYSKNFTDQKLLRYFQVRQKPNWLIYENKCPAALLKMADKAAQKKFTILGKTKTFANQIDWSASFTSRKSWFKGHFSDLNARLYSNNFESQYYIGDVKLPWEFNKHLHFVALAQAYRATGQEKYAQAFFSQIEDWLEQNPFEYNLAWTQNLIVSHRIIAWVLALGAFINSPSLTPALFRKIFNSLFEHSEYITSNYEIGEKASNHLIGNLVAQIVVCAIFPEVSDSHAKLKTALKMLESELEKQVYADGVQYEQSLSYHRVIVEFLLLVLIIGQNGDLDLPETIFKKTEKMLEFLMFMTQPNGFYQPISDADSARVFLLANNTLDARPYLTLAAAVFDRADFKYLGGDLKNVCQFLSPRLLSHYQKLIAKTPENTSRAFENGGYWSIRNNWSKNSPWLFFDCGPISMGSWPENLPIGTHGHSDTLNFGLALGKDVFLTDIGSYAYTTERPYHQYFRSTRGHNTPIIDHQDQNILHQVPWVLTQKANGKNNRYFDSKETIYISGEHDGYQRLSKPLTCRREILYLKNKKIILLRDSFFGKGDHELEENFHFHSKILLKKTAHSIVARGESHQLKITPLYSGVVRLLKKQTNPPEGWYAPEYGKKEPGSVLKITRKISANSRFITVFSWGKNLIGLDEAENLFSDLIRKYTKPKIAMLVTNNLVNDPRVQKEAATAAKNGFETKVFCFFRKTRDETLPLEQSGYKIAYLPYEAPEYFFLGIIKNFILNLLKSSLKKNQVVIFKLMRVVLPKGILIKLQLKWRSWKKQTK